MNKTWRIFNIFLLTVVVIGSAGMIALNTVIDPFSIFGSQTFAHGVDANGRFMKYEAIKNDPNKYEGLILGSSRSGIIHPDTASNIRGIRYFNASAFGARPLEILAFLGSLKRHHNYAPKEVILGFDLFPFIEQPMNGLSYRAHPEIEGISLAEYKSDYVFASSIEISLKKYLQAKESYIVRDEEHGHYSLPKFEKRIAEDHESFIAKKVIIEALEMPGGQMFDENIFTHIRALKTYLTKNNIKAFYYLQPISMWRSKKIPVHHVERYVAGLKSIFKDEEILDFTYDEEITKDPTLWYDLKHYRPIVGVSILRSTFDHISK